MSEGVSCQMPNNLANHREILEFANKEVGIGAFNWWIERCTVDATPELERLWGLEPGTSEPNQDFWCSRIIEPDQPHMEAVFAEWKSNRREDCAADFRIATPNAGEKWLHLRAKVHYSSSGQPVRMTGITMDITARRQAEEELRKSNIWFNTLVDNIPEMVYLYDPARGISFFNRRTADYLGVSPESLTGRGYLAVFHPDDLPKTIEAIKDAVTGGKPYMRRHRIRVADGSYHWFQGRAVPVDIEGNTKWFGVTSDIDNVVRLEEELKQKAQDLQDANERLAQSNLDLLRFATVVAHDLHAPLSTITSVIYTLRDECAQNLDPQVQEYLGFLEMSARRMRALLDSILEYSQLDENPGNQSALVDCNQVVVDVIGDLQSEICRSGAIITVDFLPTVLANEPHLYQVFLNLISNAIQYRRSDVTPRIRVSANEDERAWTLSVEDNGIGIDRKEVGGIFELFQKVEAQDRNRLGMGLAICKRVIEKHGGRIWVESAPGKGSRFSFTWPNDETARAPMRTADSAHSAHAGSSGCGSSR